LLVTDVPIDVVIDVVIFVVVISVAGWALLYFSSFSLILFSAVGILCKH
jgi:hypothetical protein